MSVPTGVERLSVIVPVYNEARTLRAVVDQVLAVDLPVEREVLVVDDGSTDETQEILADIEAESNGVAVIRSPRNVGKGHAVRLGLARATGSIVVIQDADLELDPQDLGRLVAPILAGQTSVVFGSRFLTKTRVPWLTACANRVLTAATNVLFGSHLTDMSTCYKVMRTDVARSLALTANRFDIDPQITSRLLRAGHRIHEVPVSYAPRSRAAGKKVGWWDGVRALRVLLAERMRRRPSQESDARWRTDRRVAAAAMVVLGLHLMLGFGHEAGLRSDDDRLYLHYLGAQFSREAEAGVLNQRMQAALESSGVPEVKQWRFQSRQEYHGNYLVPTLIYRAGGDAVRWARGGDARLDYPAYLARAMSAGYIATWLLVATALMVLVWRGRDVGWIVAVATAVAAIASLHTVFHYLPRFGIQVSGALMILPNVSTGAVPWDIEWSNIVGLLLNPGPASTIFGDTPRHHFNLLALGVFLLRWRGSLGASYGWLLGLSLVHQSHAGMLAFVLLTTDLIARPSALRSWAGGLAATAMVLWMFRETLDGFVGIASSERGLVLVIAGVLAVLVVLTLTARAARLRERLERARQRLLSRGPVAADLAVLAVIWLTSLVVAAAFNAYASPLQSDYFWRMLNGRLLAILRPALILACAHAAITLMSRTRQVGHIRRAWAIALGASALAAVACGVIVARQPLRPVDAFERGLRRIDAAVPQEIDWNTIGHAREPQIYYSLLRELERRR